MLTNKDSEAIEALDLAPIKMKLMHVESGEGWSREKVEAVEVEYRRFLYLMKKYPNEELSPTMDVDVFWHYHILDTMKYAKDCEQVFGYFLHHYPYVGLGENVDPADHARAGEHSRELYEAEFGAAPAAPAWCAATVKAAWCAASGKPAWCAASGKQQAGAWCAATVKNAWCAASGKQDAKADGAGKTAWCAATVKTAWCAASGKPEAKAGSVGNPAWCAAAVQTAWCAASGKESVKAAATGDTAWCAASAKPLAMAVRDAWCAASADRSAVAA